MKPVPFCVLGWVRGLSEGPQGGFQECCRSAMLSVRQKPDGSVPQSVCSPTTAPNIPFPESSWDVSRAICLLH